MNNEFPPEKPLKPPTFADIAQAAGVCKATVSLALRNNTRISKVTRDKINRIATNLGYQLNRELHWDPKREEFKGDVGANSMIQQRDRAPWAGIAA